MVTSMLDSDGSSSLMSSLTSASRKWPCTKQRPKWLTMKPMRPEEAALQMDLLGHDFYFFTNSETERAAVVYRRSDGYVGLIDS